MKPQMKLLIGGLVPPEVLASLSDSDMRRLEALVKRELITSHRVKRVLGEKVRAAYESLRRADASIIRFEPWKRRAIFDLDGIPVIERLKKNWRAIRDEYRTLRRASPELDGLYPLPIYEGEWRMGNLRTNPVEHEYMPPDVLRQAVVEIVGRAKAARMSAGEIEETYLRAFEHAMAANRALCPTLTRILDPLHPHACVLYSFNLMGPRVKLKPHRGTDAGHIRVHIGLESGERCFLQVGGERRTWSDGQAMAFDDHNTHFAENNGDTERVILLVDFEKSFVSNELKKLARRDRSRRR
jgi:aspartyl/asparaginyl beta-hydroxylase (cupin superfamily)